MTFSDTVYPVIQLACQLIAEAECNNYIPSDAVYAEYQLRLRVAANACVGDMSPALPVLFKMAVDVSDALSKAASRRCSK